jgi:hypothetical protein
MAGQIFGNALRREPNVIKCKILGDKPAPAGGAEFDHAFNVQFLLTPWL